MKENKKQPEELSVHDGISPIIVEEAEPAVQFRRLWKYLVPASGKAKTA